MLDISIYFQINYCIVILNWLKYMSDAKKNIYDTYISELITVSVYIFICSVFCLIYRVINTLNQGTIITHKIKNLIMMQMVFHIVFLCIFCILYDFTAFFCLNLDHLKIFVTIYWPVIFTFFIDFILYIFLTYQNFYFIDKINILGGFYTVAFFALILLYFLLDIHFYQNIAILTYFYITWYFIAVKCAENSFLIKLIYLCIVISLYIPNIMNILNLIQIY